MRHDSLISLLCAAAVLMLCSCQGSSLHYDVDRGEYPVKGIDISAHNGIVDFKSVKADSVDFVMIKASEGTEFCDAMYERNYKGATDEGLKVGAYHFFRFDVPGHLQAYHFLNVVKNTPLDLPLAIDVEEWQNAEGVPDNEVISQLHMMRDVIEAAGYRVIVYTNKNGHSDYVEPAFGGDALLWISSPSSAPSDLEWTLWQHSHEGSVKGINGPVDIDTFNGSREQFAAWSEVN